MDEDIGHAIQLEIERQLTPWIRAMTAAVKLRNASKYRAKPADDDNEPKEKFIDYNIFDELSDLSDEEDPTETKVEIVNRHRETTDLIFSLEQFNAYVTDDIFLTDKDIHPTTLVTQYPEHSATCLPWG